MELMGQGLVLMAAGMGIVYVFLYVLILVSNWASRFVSRFDHIIPDDAPRKARRAPAPAVEAAAGPAPAAVPADGTEVAAPVPGTVLRLTAADGQRLAEGDEILVMDVMKMETPITAPCAGTVTLRVAVMDKVATGDVVAVVG
jgi:sodium pump decarboxylase gamma subunit